MPSKRKSSKRKSGTTAAPSSSPSRTAKRRKTTRAPPSEPIRAESADLEPAIHDEDSDDTTSNADSQELADIVIPCLSVSNEYTAAAKDWANSNIEENFGHRVSAYAKICGRDWTYYVKRLNVRIGRPPDAGPRHGVGVESSPAPESDDPTVVQIDLGPSKLVSRSHAELYYDHDSLTWQVVVNGRNGVKINDICLRRGQQRRVNSGDVLEIAGNQMMFVAAEGQAVIHPIFLQKLREEIILADPESRNNDNHRQAQPDALAQNGNLLDTQSQTGTRPRVNGQAAIAPAPPDFVRPTTPTHSPKKSGKPGSGVKNSPAYGRGIVMESNEQIDYQSDSARDLKPTLSYASMITQAIMSMEGEVLSLDGIYKWIMAHYSYYRHVQSNWQNSIRHNLSLSSAFKKTPRGPDDPGKGSNWAIIPEKKQELLDALDKQLRRNGARRSSAPSSPAVKYPSTMDTSDSSQPHVQINNEVLKISPTNDTPPLTSYPPTAQESYTPSRGPQLAADDSHALPTLSDDASPIAPRRPPGRNGTGQGSSPTLTSGAWTSEQHPNPMMTPAPRPHNLNLPLPNTVKLPTSHMPDSSPAPFWRWTDQAGSTPARWPGEVSPLKAATLQSSSPPPAATNGIESPTRGRGMLAPAVNRGDDDDDDGGFDLARGFPKISSYHRQRNNAAAGNLVS